MRAVVVAVVIEEQLQLIVYKGARDYYFGKYLPHVEHIMASIRAS